MCLVAVGDLVCILEAENVSRSERVDRGSKSAHDAFVQRLFRDAHLSFAATSLVAPGVVSGESP